MNYTWFSKCTFDKSIMQWILLMQSLNIPRDNGLLYLCKCYKDIAPFFTWTLVQSNLIVILNSIGPRIWIYYIKGKMVWECVGTFKSLRYILMLLMSKVPNLLKHTMALQILFEYCAKILKIVFAQYSLQKSSMKIT